jgi:hypothetical protein
MHVHTMSERSRHAKRACLRTPPSRAPGSTGMVSAIRGACTCGGGCPRCASAKQVPVSARQGDRERAANRTADRVLDSGETRARPKNTSQAAAKQMPIDHGGWLPRAMGLGDGTPLPESARAYFEPRFNADLSGVRVHTGERAAREATQLAARAFAFGTHIVFGRGEYAPDTAVGRRLLVHELAHVVQGPAGLIQRTSYSDCSSGEQPELEAAVSRAFSWLGTVYAMLLQTPTPDRARFALQLAFRNDSAAVVEQVKRVIAAIMSGIPRATLECENPGGLNYRLYCQGMEAQGFVRWTSGLTGIGNIHVCMGPDIWGTLSDARRAHVVIHESAHLFVNADSYACFVYLAIHHGEDVLREFLADRAGHTLAFTQSPQGEINLRSGRDMDTWFTVGIPRGEGHTELPPGFRTRFYFIDEAYNEYPVDGLAGPASEFGTQGAAYLPTRTRAQLMERGIRQGRLMCRVRIPQNDYLFEIPVRFRY